MRIEFTKMHGLGNDFMVVDNTAGDIEFAGDTVRQLADRNFGIGFDQLLIVAKPSVPEAEFDYRIYNADGSEVEHCGNGARCFAAFVHDKGLTTNRQIPVQTCAGLITLEMLGDNQVKVLMGVPEFAPQLIPVDAARAVPPAITLDAEKSFYSLSLDDSAPQLSEAEKQSLILSQPSVASGSVEFCALSIGNPHIVIPVTNTEQAPVNTLGPWLESHAMFPSRINVGFCQTIDSGNIRLRVFERGVGETIACGSGACAALAAGFHNNWIDSQVKARLNGGFLQLEWPGFTRDVEMTGPCTKVFEGQIEL